MARRSATSAERILGARASVGTKGAVAAGYGVNLRTMFSRGLWLTLWLWLTIVIVGSLLATYWSGFGVA